jgi:chromate transporter
VGGIDLFVVLLRASLFSLGGQSGLPLLRHDLVETGFLSDRQIIQSLVVGRLGTGPGGLYVVAVGYMVAGWLGAAIALVAIVIPPLLVFPLSAYLRPRTHRRWVNGLIRGLSLASSGLVAATGLQLLGGIAEGGPAPWQVGLVAVGLLLTLGTKLHPFVAILVGAGVGLLLGRW